MDVSRSRAEDRLRRLVTVASRLSEASTPEDVAALAVRAVEEVMGADSASVCLLEPDGSAIRLLDHLGLRPSDAAAWQTFPADAPVPVVDAMRTGEPVVVADLEDRRRRYPVFGDEPMTSETLVTCPMAFEGLGFGGALVVGFREPTAVSDDEVAFMQAVADLCGQAIHRAHLEALRRDQLGRERFLAEAGVVLAGSLELDETLRRVARLAADAVADVCAVLLLEPDGSLRVVAAAHRDPAGQPVLDALVDRRPAVDEGGLLEVLASGEALLTPAITPEEAVAEAEDDAHRALLRDLDPTSAVTVPLRARDRDLGVLLLLGVGEGALDEGDRSLAVELAARAALAIDNSRLHREREELVQNLRVALASQTVIEQAKGVLVARWDISPSEAFEHLRRSARSQRRKVDAVAQDVMAGRLDVLDRAG